MKKSLILLLLITSFSYSQGVTINVSQDARLLFFGDDKGNEAGTLDLTIASEWRIKSKSKNYFFIRPEFEIAELQGGTYKRYSANLGITFKEWIDKVGFTSSLGYGVIDYNGAYRSVGANFQTSYNITKSLEIFIDLELVDRKDLQRYTSNKLDFTERIRTSGKFGLKLEIFKPR